MAVWTRPQLNETYLNRRIDSEFFDPAYLKAENDTLKCQTENLGPLGQFIPGPFGSAFHVQNYDYKSLYRYIRGRDVKPFFLLDDDNRYVPEGDFNRLKKYSVLPNDLMISVVGTLGHVSVCTENDAPAVFSCKSTIFRSRKVDPYYLLAYLNCHYGKMCLLRRQRGAVQTGLNIEDLRAIPVPRFNVKIEAEISNFVQAAQHAAIHAKESYAQAQQLLESELGLDKLCFEKPVGYTARFSELELLRRFDADYFQPKYRQLDALAAKYPIARIKDLSEKLETGLYSPTYSQNGKPYIRGTDISAGFIGSIGLLRSNVIKPSPKAVVKNNDILVTRVGSIGVCGIVEQNLSGSLFSDNLIRIRLKENLLDTILPSFLNLLLNTTYGQMQMVRFSRGSVQQRLNQSQLGQIPIPCIHLEIQKKIEELLTHHSEAKQESRNLLNRAKSRVEQLIEEAVQP